MRQEPGGDNGSEPTFPIGPTFLVPPVDPYLETAEPFEVAYPTPLPVPRPWYTSPAVIFGLVGTLLGVIALAVVITVNCGRLGICDNKQDLAALALLPPSDADRYLVSTNPHLPGGLAADVNQLLDLIPAADQPRARSFVGGTRFFVGRLPAAQARPDCGYQGGDLTIRLYQDRGSAWSVGLAVVVTGTLVDVFEETSACFLGRRIAAMVPVREDSGPDPAFCAAEPRDGFTVLTLGSTVGACADLTRSPTLRARTVGDPDTALRAEPGTAGPPTLRVRPGTVGTVVCHRDGWARITFPTGTPDTLTGKSTEDEQTGFVAAADLDTGAELAQRIRACGSAASPPPSSPPQSSPPQPSPPQSSTPQPLPQRSSTPQSSTTASATPAFNPAAVTVGECVANRGTPERPDMRTVACTDPTSYRVLRKTVGVDIPEGLGGGFDATTANVVCAGTDYDTWYGYNVIDDSADVFLCLLSTAKSRNS